MAVKTKPGIDTLWYFWLAILCYFAGMLLIALEPFARVQGDSLAVLMMTPLGIAALGCYLVAGVFAVVVVHKIIAMLIYLVHAKL